MINYYVDSKRARDITIKTNKEPSFSCLMYLKSFMKALFKEHVSFCLPIKRKFSSQSGCWKVKDEQSKYSNISENFSFPSTTAILYVFWNEKEICLKHDATFIVNYSNIKEILDWSKILITKKISCRLLGSTLKN